MSSIRLGEEQGFYFGLALFVQILILIFFSTLPLTSSLTTQFLIFFITLIVLVCSLIFYGQEIFGESKNYYWFIIFPVLLEFILWIVVLADSKDFLFEEGGKILFLGLQLLHVLLTTVFLYKTRKTNGLSKLFGFLKFNIKLTESLTNKCALERCRDAL